MTDATSILNCEVWQMGHSETDIEAALLKIYRTLLGVEAKTATDGLRHELGIASQKVRADRFFTSLFRRRLGILAAQGEGL